MSPDSIITIEITADSTGRLINVLRFIVIASLIQFRIHLNSLAQHSNSFCDNHIA